MSESQRVCRTNCQTKVLSYFVLLPLLLNALIVRRFSCLLVCLYVVLPPMTSVHPPVLSNRPRGTGPVFVLHDDDGPERHHKKSIARRHLAGLLYNTAMWIYCGRKTRSRASFSCKIASTSTSILGAIASRRQRQKLAASASV